MLFIGVIYSYDETTTTSFKTCTSMIKWKIFEQFKFCASKLQELRNSLSKSQLSL